jgi:CMP-N,N'-diacetyllegionaminic acid synthase
MQHSSRRDENMGNRILAIIPARSGSKGIHNKNLARVGGHTLLEWSIAAAGACKHIDEIIVSTDSEEYAQLAKDYGAEVPFLRPDHLAQDNSTDFEFISHCISELTKLGRKPNLIVHLRPTSPLRETKILDEAIAKYLEIGDNFTSLRSIQKMSESAYKTFELDDSETLMSVCKKDYNIDVSNDARQSFPNTFYPNGYIDILSTRFIEKNNKIHGNKVYGFITPRIIEVDEAFDLEMLNYEFARTAINYHYMNGGQNE